MLLCMEIMQWFSYTVSNLCNVTLSLKIRILWFTGQKRTSILPPCSAAHQEETTWTQEAMGRLPWSESSVSLKGLQPWRGDEHWGIQVVLSLVNLCDNTKGYTNSSGWNSQQVNQLWALPDSGQNLSHPSYGFFLFTYKNKIIYESDASV